MEFKISELNIGKMDASNELLDTSEKTITRFKNAYLIPQSIKFENFLNGEKYFITGMKGTGKTALLRYLDILANEKFKALTTFVLFKSDITEEDRLNFAQSSNTIIVRNVIDKINEKQLIQEYERVWEIFFHRLIAEQIKDIKVGPFKDSKHKANYIKYIKITDPNDEESGIKKIIPKLTKGAIKIDVDVAELGIDFEWENKKKRTVSLGYLADEMQKLLIKLSPGEKKLNIYLDELELSHVSDFLHDRDAVLIRDLIIVIERFNKLFRKRDLPVRIFAGIRSEVLEAVAGKGKEINKSIDDFGEQIYWHGKSTNNVTHPLIKIAIKKIRAAEELLGHKSNLNDNDFFNKYFPRHINNIAAAKYILDNTWYRPRDIVRMLSKAAAINPNETSYTHAAFDESKREYSRLSWVELSEELSANFSPNYINAIKIMLTGFKAFFWLDEIQKRAIDMSNIYGKKYGFSAIDASTLIQLFKVGIIGNGTKGNVRFASRGNDHLFIEQIMMIHPALWPYFAVTNRKD